MDISKIRLENQDYNVKDKIARENIEDLKISVFKNFKGKVCFFGDSYGAMTTNWIDELQELLEIPNENVLLKFAHGGSGFIGRGGAPTWVSGINDLVNNTTEEERNQVSAIIVAGGFNDRGYQKQYLYGAMSNFNTTIKENFPNATVYLAMIGWTIDNTTEDLGIEGGFIFNLQSVLPIYSLCGELGWKFLENCQYVMHDFTYFESDKVHPNALGAKAIAGSMYSAINGNVGIHKPWLDLEKELVAEVGGITGASQIKLDNDVVTMYIATLPKTLDIGFRSVTNFQKGTFYPCFNIVNGYGVSDLYRPIIKETIMYHKENSIDTEFNGQLVIQQGQIGFIPLEDFTSNYISIPRQIIEFSAMQF